MTGGGVMEYQIGIPTLFFNLLLVNNAVIFPERTQERQWLGQRAALNRR